MDVEPFMRWRRHPPEHPLQLFPLEDPPGRFDECSEQKELFAWEDEAAVADPGEKAVEVDGDVLRRHHPVTTQTAGTSGPT